MNRFWPAKIEYDPDSGIKKLFPNWDCWKLVNKFISPYIRTE